MKKTNILFVCKYNRFRSRIAEAYFNKINKNKRIKAKSAGLIKGNQLDKNQIKLAKEFGLNIRGKTQGLNIKILKWQDTIIIVANDVPPSIFSNNKKYGKKVIVWKIPDNLKTEKETINKVIKPIINKVDILNKQLKKGEIK